MTIEYKDVIRLEFATESGSPSPLKDGMDGYFLNTLRMCHKFSDGTLRVFGSMTEYASQSGTVGSELIGTSGITGVTPNGGSSGAAATVKDMLLGLKDYVDSSVNGSSVIVNPASSVRNQITNIVDQVTLLDLQYTGTLDTTTVFRVGNLSGNQYFTITADSTIIFPQFSGSGVGFVGIDNSGIASFQSTSFLTNVIKKNGFGAGDNTITNTGDWAALTIVGYSGQFEDLFSIQDSSTTPVYGIKATGVSTQAGRATFSDGITASGSTSTFGSITVNGTSAINANLIMGSGTGIYNGNNSYRMILQGGASAGGSIVLNGSSYATNASYVNYYTGTTAGAKHLFLSGTTSDPAFEASDSLFRSYLAARFDSTVLLNSLTASTALLLDGSKNIVSQAYTGAGNVVRSASPTFTGTITAAAANFSSSVFINGAAVGGSFFSVRQGTDQNLHARPGSSIGVSGAFAFDCLNDAGSVVIPFALRADDIYLLGGNVNINHTSDQGFRLAVNGTGNFVGDFSVNTNKFTVSASTGDTVVGGVLTATGNIETNITAPGLVQIQGSGHVIGVYQLTHIANSVGVVNLTDWNNFIGELQTQGFMA